MRKWKHLIIKTLGHYTSSSREPTSKVVGVPYKYPDAVWLFWVKFIHWGNPGKETNDGLKVTFSSGSIKEKQSL